ncbi:hypothetical protein, partial [Pseudomonas phage ZCPA1]
MTVDTYVLSDQVVLKNGNIMTQPEVVAELNSQARAALARVAELRNALNNIVHASEYTTSATHQAEVERIAFAALNGAQPAAQAQHSVPGDIMRDAQRYRWLRDQQFYFSFSTENS